MEREEWMLGVRGKTGVGSLSFIQFVQNHFITMDPTYLDDDSLRKQISVDDAVCIIEINVMRLYEDEHQWGSKVWWAQDWARRIQGCILAYSQADRSSFDEIPKYIDQIMRIKEVNTVEQFIPIIIIETKCDLDAQHREVSIEEGQALAKQYNAPFFSTSAKYRTNVEETVHELVRLCRRRRDDALVLQKKKKPIRRAIPTSAIVLPQPNSTLVEDIQKYLLDVEKYSDLVLKVGDRNIYVHKAVLFSRSPSFMEKIKPTDKVMDLSTLDYSAVLNIMKYLYTGKFQRENVSNDKYKPAIMKLEVYNLLPILKQEEVVIEGFDPKFERLFNLNFASNLKIVVKESKKTEREIYCHKMILCARSAYFRTMYHGGFKESDAAELVVDNCSYDAMFFLIRYYYLDVKQIDNESIVCDVLRVAHMYDEKPVIQLIESYLQTHLSVDTVCFVLMLCDLFSLSQLLKSACEEFISYRFKKVSKTSSFKKLTPEVQKQLESSQKEGLWSIPESDKESIVLLKLFKNFKL